MLLFNNPTVILEKLLYTYFGNYIPSDIYEFPLEIGSPLKFFANGNITKLRFYKPIEETGSHTMRIWDTFGTELTSVSFGSTFVGWNEATLSSPFPVLENEVYIISVNANAFFSIAYSNPVEPSSSLVRLNNTNGRYSVSIGSFPNSGTDDGSYYFTDVVFEV